MLEGLGDALAAHLRRLWPAAGEAALTLTLEQPPSDAVPRPADPVLLFCDKARARMLRLLFCVTEGVTCIGQLAAAHSSENDDVLLPASADTAGAAYAAMRSCHCKAVLLEACHVCCCDIHQHSGAWLVPYAAPGVISESFHG